MFSLFVALFGGLYYGAKISSEKSKIKECENQNKSFYYDINRLKILYGVDESSVNEIEEFIRCGKHYDEICDLLCDDLKYALGEDWKKILDIPNGAWRKCMFLPEYHEYWVLHLLLSKKGKMDKWVMTMGYPWNAVRTKERNKKFMYCIERNLIKAGVQEIKLVCETKPNGISLVKPEQFCICPHYRIW